MKSERLREIGLTQEQIDVVMAENGKDINAAKGNVEHLTTQVSELQNQLGERDTQLKELKKDLKDNETLTNKIAELEKQNETMAAESKSKIEGIQKNHAIENGVREAKAKNMKAVIALLDMEKITYKDGQLSGLSEQLENLKKGEDSSFLFGETQPNKPAGTTPPNPPSGGTGGNQPSGNTFAQAIANALNANKN